MASKTAWDISEELTRLPVGTLPLHSLEHLTLTDLKTELEQLEQPVLQYDNPQGPSWLPPSNMVNKLDFAHLMEVYVDDFIQAAQSTDPAQLQHLSRAMLLG